LARFTWLPVLPVCPAPPILPAGVLLALLAVSSLTFNFPALAWLRLSEFGVAAFPETGLETGLGTGFSLLLNFAESKKSFCSQMMS
jgi:hypothetical protein